MNILSHIICVSLLLGSLPANAQSELTADTGLDDVRACAVLGPEVTVAATDGGLAIIDGGNVSQIWTRLDGLPGTRIHSLHIRPHEDGGADIFVGAEHGLAWMTWQNGMLRHVRNWTPGRVTAMADYHGQLRIAVWGIGLYRLPKDKGELQVDWRPADAKNIARSRIHALRSHDDHLYAATAGTGLLRFHHRAFKPHVIPGEENHLFTLAVKEARLWVGGLGVLGQVRNTRIVTHERADVRALAVMGGQLLMGTFGGGIPDLPELAMAAHVQTIATSPWGSCVGAREGLWVTRPTAGDGWKSIALGGPPSNDITAIVSDGAHLYAGTFNHGVAVHVDERWFPIGAETIDSRVNALAVQLVSAQGPAHIWVATDGGLARIVGRDITRWTSLDGLPSDHVLSLATLRSGEMLVGTAGGAVILGDGGIRPVRDKEMGSLRGIWAVTEDHGGALWFGTARGLHRRSPQGQWQRFGVVTGHLQDDWVTALVASDDGVWVGTYSGGIAHLQDRGNRVVANQYGSSHVNPGGLWVHDGAIYAATMEGWQVRESPLDEGFELRDAMTTGRDVTDTVVHDGQLWVASRSGLTRIQWHEMATGCGRP